VIAFFGSVVLLALHVQSLEIVIVMMAIIGSTADVVSVGASSIAQELGATTNLAHVQIAPNHKRSVAVAGASGVPRIATPDPTAQIINFANVQTRVLPTVDAKVAPTTRILSAQPVALTIGLSSKIVTMNAARALSPIANVFKAGQNLRMVGIAGRLSTGAPQEAVIQIQLPGVGVPFQTKHVLNRHKEVGSCIAIIILLLQAAMSGDNARVIPSVTTPVRISRVTNMGDVKLVLRLEIIACIRVFQI